MIILNSSNIKLLDTNSIILNSFRKTSSTKQIFTCDVLYLNDKKKHPFLIQTPTLTITSNILNQNNYTNLFLGLKNLEYDNDIQKFYLFLTKIEHNITQHLFLHYQVSDSYSSFQILDKFQQTNDLLNLFINTDKCVSLCINIKKNITNVYNKFKKKYEDHLVFCDSSILNKGVRAQFIIELPNVWFELNEDNLVKRIGFNWSALQIKIVDQCSITECLIEDEVKPIAKIPIPPPPPPPPLPGIGLGSSKRISSLDILGGIAGLKKSENDDNKRKYLKPKNTNGFKPPTLDDILNTLKKMKNKN